MGVSTRWWRRSEDAPVADAWGGPDEVTLTPASLLSPTDARPSAPAPTPVDDDRRAQERRLAEQKAAEHRAAQEQAAREQAARETADREQAAQEKAAQEKAAQEKAAQERAAQEQAEAARERAAREEAEREAEERRAAEAEVAARIDAERRAVEREAVAARETVPAGVVPGVSAVARDPEAGVRERQQRRRRVMIVLLVALVAVAAVWVIPRLVSAALSLGRGAGAPAPNAAEQLTAAAPALRPDLPRGGAQFFPAFRVVAYYGTPDNPQMGVLGTGTPEEMADRLETAAAPFAGAGRTVLPAMELIVQVADGAPGPDGNYSHAIDEAQAWRYLAVARAHRQLLVLDLQPGGTDFLTTARPWERILREPDVGLALDPEWRMPPGQVPGLQIGTVAADEVNETSAWLADIVRTSNVPQKLFVVHQFTPNMVTNPERLATPPELAVVQHVDGFGAPPNKIARYQELVRPGHLLHGFKLFYTQDTPMLDPRQTLGLTPTPDFVTYQ